MDRYGRKIAGVPCATIMGISVFILPLGTSFWPLFFIIMLFGVGDALGSVVIGTIGGDNAKIVASQSEDPEGARNGFLGVFQRMSNYGRPTRPALAGALAHGGTLVAWCWHVI